MSHVLSIVLMMNEKFREKVSGAWDTFSNDPEKFGIFFGLVLRLLVPDDKQQQQQQQESINNSTKSEDTLSKKRGSKKVKMAVVEEEQKSKAIETEGETNSISMTNRRHLLSFLVYCFSGLENEVVRGEVLKLVGIGMWETLENDNARELILKKNMAARKLWNRAIRRKEKADVNMKKQIHYCNHFLSSLLRQFLEHVSIITPSNLRSSIPTLEVINRSLELFTDLISQLPTRRYFNSVVKDHLVVELTQRSALSQIASSSSSSLSQLKEITLFKALLHRLAFYVGFEIDDLSGESLSRDAYEAKYASDIKSLQNIVFIKYRNELKDLAMSHISGIAPNLRGWLNTVNDDIIKDLCHYVAIRTIGVNGVEYDREFLISVFVQRFQRRESQIDKINSYSLYPDEVNYHVQRFFKFCFFVFKVFSFRYHHLFFSFFFCFIMHFGNFI